METLQALINAAQVFLEKGFSADDYLVWQQLSFLTILALLGPLHFYTKHFGLFTETPSRRSLLAGEGILEAAKGEIAGGASKAQPDGKTETSAFRICYTPWVIRPKKWYSLECLRDRLLGPTKVSSSPDFDDRG
jgi:hypothetical protein